jgi:phosphatidylinositol alpha-mannosyltransferase
MKIAIISLYLPSGSKIGVGYQVHSLANELVKRGHEVTVFSQTGPSEDSLYKVEVVPSGRRLRTFGFGWNLRHCDFSGFDVLNAHGEDWALRGRKLPRLVHTFMGSCKAEMMNVKGLKERARMGMLALSEFNACFLADELVAISENTRQFIPRVRHVIPCGVDMEMFSPSEEKSEAPSLLFVGTMHGRKRGAMLLDIFQREVKPRVPNAEFWAVCETKVEGDGVRWLGRIPTEELAEHFRKAWSFCLPSTYEGFGVPYIEAMASGTPVIATPNVGAREVCQEGASGVIVPDEQLGEAIVQMLTDAELRRKMRAAGLQRARDFRWERVCEQYEAVYANDLVRLKELAAS